MQDQAMKQVEVNSDFMTFSFFQFFYKSQLLQGQYM